MTLPATPVGVEWHSQSPRSAVSDTPSHPCQRWVTLPINSDSGKWQKKFAKWDSSLCTNHGIVAVNIWRTYRTVLKKESQSYFRSFAFIGLPNIRYVHLQVSICISNIWKWWGLMGYNKSRKNSIRDENKNNYQHNGLMNEKSLLRKFPLQRTMSRAWNEIFWKKLDNCMPTVTKVYAWFYNFFQVLLMATSEASAILAPKILDFQCPPLITPLVMDVYRIQITPSHPI